MAEINGPMLTICGLFASTSLAFSVYHTYKYDGCRCLLPNRKEWVKVLLTWMLLVANLSYCGWAWGWAYVKYQLGWVAFGPHGARPWPSALFPPFYAKFNTPLIVVLGICYSLQASLNAQEGLYWYHIIRAVRRPHTATPWIGSWYFYAWIGVSITSLTVQMFVPWVGEHRDLQVQLAKELLMGAVLEFVVLVGSTIVVFKFPVFLSGVHASGVSSEVRTRLHFFHEANKVRTFFRFTFTIPLFILGADGITTQALINNHPLVSDTLATILTGSFAIVLMISIVLYLPRSTPSQRALARQKAGRHLHGQGQVYGNTRQGDNGAALMSLLREGGQLDYEDDDIPSPIDQHTHTGRDSRQGKQAEHQATFADAADSSDARSGSWTIDKEEKVWNDQAQRSVPNVLEDFTSPIAVNTESLTQRPVEIRMQVEREIKQD